LCIAAVLKKYKEKGKEVLCKTKRRSRTKKKGKKEKAKKKDLEALAS
jgi:hypothetical protein